MPTIVRSEIKHKTCAAAPVAESTAEHVRVDPNGNTTCPVCNLTDINLNFSSTIELDNGYIFERPL